MNYMLMINHKVPSRKSRMLMDVWATPLTIGAFILSALTGSLLFFKIHLGLVKPVHEWLSWLLVIGTVFHLWVNWRPSVRHFSRPIGRAIIVIFCLLTCASLFPWLPSGSGGEGRHHPAETMVEALLQAPLMTVAQVAKQTPESIAEIMGSRGINLASWQQTPREIADDNDKKAWEVLTLIFQKQAVNK